MLPLLLPALRRRLALLLPAFAVLFLSACNQASPDTAATAVSTNDTVPPAKLFALFQPQPLPVTIPVPNRRNDALVPPDIGVYNAFLVGKDRLFEADPQKAYVPYSRIAVQGKPWNVLVMLEEAADGSHYWLCTLNSMGKLIDKKEIAFTRVGEGLNHDRTATIEPDLSVNITDVYRQRTIARDSIELTKMGRPMIETVTENKYVLQVDTDGKISGQLPATATVSADTTAAGAQ